MLSSRAACRPRRCHRAIGRQAWKSFPIGAHLTRSSMGAWDRDARASKSGSTRQWVCDALKRFAFSIYAQLPFGRSRNKQQGCGQHITDAHHPGRSRLDQPAEQKRREAAANGRTERVETRDRKRPRFERKYFAGGEIGRTSGGRREEEDYKPRASLGDLG